MQTNASAFTFCSYTPACGGGRDVIQYWLTVACALYI